MHYVRVQPGSIGECRAAAVRAFLDHLDSNLLIKVQSNLLTLSTRMVLRFTALLVVWPFLLLADPAGAAGQTLRVQLSIVSAVPARIRIQTEFPTPTNSLSFRNAYADILGLGERIVRVEAMREGVGIPVSALAPGEFRTEAKFSSFRYEVNLPGPAHIPQKSSHVSWLTKDEGLLLLADLLPTVTAKNYADALITVEVPAGWAVASNVKRAALEFFADDPDNAAFLIGPGVAEKSQAMEARTLTLITAGKWAFSDKDALKVARRIIRGYSELTRFELKRDAFVMLIPFEGAAGPERWSAETRGNVVVLLLGQKASGRKVLSRLGIVLSHELFHIWVPNSLKLAGAYDWFFEGFTLYQALLMDLRLGLISFDGYLETLASVYDAYWSSPDRERLSLLDASERRWTTSSQLVYEKGMLAAFVYDLSLRSRTNCRESLADVYQKLFRSELTGQENANETIIGLLTEREGFASFARDFVAGTGELKLEQAASVYGIEVVRSASGTKLVVGNQLTNEQRQLLGCLGFRK